MRPLYSSHLKIVKRLEPEMTNASEAHQMGGMATQPAERSIDAIAARLRRTRLALGHSQTELCRIAGIATNTYNQYENAKGRPELDKAILLCDAFNLTLDWIYFGDPAGLPHGLAVKLLDQTA